MISDKARKLAHAYAREAGHARGTVWYKARYAHFLRAWAIAYPEGVKAGESKVERMRAQAEASAHRNEQRLDRLHMVIASLRHDLRQLKDRLKSYKRRNRR